MTLVLHQTNFALLDGDGPDIIDLKAAKTVIGRGSQTMPVDIVVSARKEGLDIISRNHASISRTADGNYCVQDLKALNGTYVNSEKVSTCTLRHGDILQFGGVSSLPNKHNGFCVRYIFQADFEMQGRNIVASPRNDNKKNLSFSKNANQVDKKKGTKREAKSIINYENSDGDNAIFEHTGTKAETQKKKKINKAQNDEHNDLTAPKVRTVFKMESEPKNANLNGCIEHDIPETDRKSKKSKNNDDRNDNAYTNGDSISGNNKSYDRNQIKILNLREKWIGDEFSVELGRLKTELAVLKETIRSSETAKLKPISSSLSSSDFQEVSLVPNNCNSSSLPITTSKSNFNSSSTPSSTSQSLPLPVPIPTSKSTSPQKWGPGRDNEKKREGIVIYYY